MKCFVWIVALYSAETWILKWSKEEQLKSFEMWMWKIMERVNGQTK